MSARKQPSGKNDTHNPAMTGHTTLVNGQDSPKRKIRFEFKKKINDGAITNFRAKAPVDMYFGELFYYFINDYNERHPDGRVEYVNGSGEPNGWVFYKKPRWHTLGTSYIDAEKTIFNNHIKENDVIICSRSLI